MSRRFLQWGFIVCLAGCTRSAGGGGDLPHDGAKDSPARPVAPVTAASLQSAPILLFIGTSITAGYGLSPEQAWTNLIQERIDSLGLHFRVVGAGVSGETSAGALRRVDWVLGQGTPRVVMIETGANDGLRGQDITALANNLDLILTRIEAVDPPPVVIVAGMEALPNMGAEYVNQFRLVYPRAAAQHHAHYLPFLLDGVAGRPRFNQADGIHPNAAGSRLVAENVWRLLAPLLDSLTASR